MRWPIDESLWAEVLNLGNDDVLAPLLITTKCYQITVLAGSSERQWKKRNKLPA